MYWHCLRRPSPDASNETFMQDRRESFPIPRRPVQRYHLRSLLLALYRAGIKLHTLRCGDVSYSVLLVSEADFEKIQWTMSKLRTLKLTMTTQDSDLAGDEGHGNYVLWNRQCTLEAWDNRNKSNRFNALLTGIPDLETLALHFTGNRLQLQDIVGKKHWRSLNHLSLSRISSSEESLFDFLNTHAHTLRMVYLKSLGLSTGYWRSILPRLRTVLVLQDFSFEGTCIDRNERWNMDSCLPHIRQKYPHASTVKKYMLHDGPWPFPLPPLDWSYYPY